MNIPSWSIGQLVEAVLDGENVKRATYYFTEKTTAKVTLGRKLDKRDRRATVIVSIGRPNYREAEFIKKCKAAGEPFPVKKFQLQYFPKKKAKK